MSYDVGGAVLELPNIDVPLSLLAVGLPNKDWSGFGIDEENKDEGVPPVLAAVPNKDLFSFFVEPPKMELTFVLALLPKAVVCPNIFGCWVTGEVVLGEQIIKPENSPSVVEVLGVVGELAIVVVTNEVVVFGLRLDDVVEFPNNPAPELPNIFEVVVVALTVVTLFCPKIDAVILGVGATNEKLQ